MTAAIERLKAQVELMTTEQTAEMCNLGARTVWRWSRSGRMPAPLKLGDGRQGAVRFRRSEIMQWIAAGCPRVDGGQDGGQHLLERIVPRCGRFFGRIDGRCFGRASRWLFSTGAGRIRILRLLDGSVR